MTVSNPVWWAGGYFELFLWALAVFVWRVTMPGTTINYLAFLVLSLRNGSEINSRFEGEIPGILKIPGI